jgi:hypothetical protein
VFRVIISAIVGGILVFLWGMVSWMVLPYHTMSIHQFKDEAAITKAITAQVDHSGVYVLPFVPADILSKPAAEQKASWGEVQAKQEKGPLVFASVSLEGLQYSMQYAMTCAALLQIAGAFIISLILWCFCCSGYFCRVLTVSTIGLLVGLLGLAPFMIWWKFSQPFILTCAADALIGWTIAGIFMAGIVKPAKCKK